MTPHSVHYGHAQALHVRRQETLDVAFTAHPQRFKGKRPEPHAMPTEVWINPPKTPPIDPEKIQPRTLN